VRGSECDVNYLLRRVNLRCKSTALLKTARNRISTRSMGKNLPLRMFHKHGAFYFVTRIDGKQKWFRLDKDYQLALYKYADMEGKTSDQGTVSGLIQRYRSDVLPGKAAKTQADRKWQLDRLDNVFGKMRLESIPPPHIQQYLDKREKKVSANREI